MRYNPFARGPFPVAVRTASLADAVRQRPLAIEVWYPATDAYAGQDLADPTRDAYEVLPGLPAIHQDAVRDAVPRRGTYPLIAFSHGFGGQRRQSTFLCTHLASHGYVVAAVDHTGNTTLDVMQAILGARRGGSVPDPLETVREFIALRPLDVRFAIDRVLDGTAGGVEALIDPSRIGVTGHSFGGWTTLAVVAQDPRIRAALPLAPAGGSNAFVGNPLGEALDFDWRRDVPTFFLVAERDSVLPLSGMHELLERTRATKKMVVLKNGDHMHFCDRAEEAHEMFRAMPPPGLGEVAKRVPPFSELCPAEHGYDFVRGLGLAHMDAVLKSSEAAARFLDGDIRAALAERGVNAEVW